MPTSIGGGSGSGAGGGGLSASTPYAAADYSSGPHTVAAFDSFDVPLDELTCITVTGDASSVMTWDVGSPTDIHLEKGIYEYTAVFSVHGDTGTSSTSPAIAYFTAAASVAGLTDLSGGVLVAALNAVIPYGSLSGHDGASIVTGKFAATDDDPANNIFGVAVGALIHGIVVDSLDLRIIQLAAL